MKNSSKIVLLVTFILIGFSLGFSCYQIKYYYEVPRCKSLFGDLGNRNKLITLSISILTSLPTLFLPAVIVIFSFYWRFSFKRIIRLVFIAIFLISLSLSTMIMVGTSIHFYKVEFTTYYWLIHIWNFSGTLWVLLLALPFKKRVPLIHWPFDDRDKTE